MITSILNRLLNKRVIVNCERQPYLHRWYLIRTKNFGVFIHKFVRSDEDRALHDHPWDFIVIPIWRGYIEHSDRPCKCYQCQTQRILKRQKPTHDPETVSRRVWPILGTRSRPATYRHRVELFKEFVNTQSPWDSLGTLSPQQTGRNKPAWSIFIRFKAIREWGFWPSYIFVPFNKWWQQKCE